LQYGPLFLLPFVFRLSEPSKTKCPFGPFLSPFFQDFWPVPNPASCFKRTNLIFFMSCFSFFVGTRRTFRPFSSFLIPCSFTRRLSNKRAQPLVWLSFCCFSPYCIPSPCLFRLLPYSLPLFEFFHVLTFFLTQSWCVFCFLSLIGNSNIFPSLFYSLSLLFLFCFSLWWVLIFQTEATFNRHHRTFVSPPILSSLQYFFFLTLL